MKTVSNPEIGNDELICPITLEVIDDPVITKDGHVYERAAITKWISEHGTSPLTREPLRIEELQSNDHLRRLVAERYNPTVSYSTRLDRAPLPTLQPVPPIITEIHPVQLNPVVMNRQRNKRKRCLTILLSILSALIPPTEGRII